jgi:hypothetical protein
VSFFVCSTLGYNWLGTHGSAFPKAIQDRPYLNDGLCGTGTPFACPAPSIPSPRGNGSLQVGLNGHLIPLTTTRAP